MVSVLVTQPRPPKASAVHTQRHMYLFKKDDMGLEGLQVENGNGRPAVKPPAALSRVNE